MQDYLAIVFIQYFNLTLLNEFLLNHFLSELLNNRDNLILPQEEYSKKANKIFALLLDVADFNKLYSLANEEKPFFGRLQANYTKYFTKDPQKIGNYSLFGNLLVNYYLSLVYLKKIRVRSQYIFEAIHQRIMACQLGHRDKSIYTAFFTELLRQHFQMLYPDWKLKSTKRLYNAYQVRNLIIKKKIINNLFKISHDLRSFYLGKNYIFMNKFCLKPIYFIWLQFLLFFRNFPLVSQNFH